MLEASFHAAPSRRVMQAGVTQGGIISHVLFTLSVNDMPIPYRHVELALYADDMAVIATSRKPALLVSYLEAYLADLESGETPSTFRRARRCSSLAGASRILVQFGCSGNQSYGWIQPVIWVWPLINSWPGRLHIDQVRKKAPRNWGCGVLSWKGGVAPGRLFCCTRSSFVQWWTMRAPYEDHSSLLC